MGKGRFGMPYAEVLHEAHKRGIAGIGSEIVQIPDEHNEYKAIVKAQALLKIGEEVIPFTAHGEAWPKDDAGGKPGPSTDATLRMAETRAKKRALLDAIDRGSDPEIEQASATDDQIIELTSLLKTDEHLTWFETRVGHPFSETTEAEARAYIPRIRRRMEEQTREQQSQETKA